MSTTLKLNDLSASTLFRYLEAVGKGYSYSNFLRRLHAAFGMEMIEEREEANVEVQVQMQDAGVRTITRKMLADRGARPFDSDEPVRPCPVEDGDLRRIHKLTRALMKDVEADGSNDDGICKQCDRPRPPKLGYETLAQILDTVNSEYEALEERSKSNGDAKAVETPSKAAADAASA